MKIVQLTAENVKRLKAVEITPEGNLVVVGGDNEQGKSSLLDSIAMALGGKSEHCDQPIRKGEDSAEVVCTLDDLVVTRRWTPKATTLTVAAKDGSAYRTPQAMLDKLLGRLTFDPLGFCRMSPDEQAETLRSAVGFDPSELDRQREAAYNRRRDVNRDVKALGAQLDAAESFPDAPTAPVSIAELSAALDKEQEARVKKQKAVGERDHIESEQYRAQEVVGQLQLQIELLQGRLEEALKKHEQFKQKAIDAQMAIDTMSDPGVEDIQAQIAAANETNRQVEANAKVQTLVLDLMPQRAKAEKLTEDIARIDQEKDDALKAVAFPVDGLSLGEAGVTFRGLPFAQASSAEQLTVSVAIGFALNPKLRVLLIRDGSLLDAQHLSVIGDLAAEHDGQIWIERVGQGEEMTVVLEDGSIKKETP